MDRTCLVQRGKAFFPVSAATAATNNWRRRPELNRRIAVLQTDPLATWVRRLNRLLFYTNFPQKLRINIEIERVLSSMRTLPCGALLLGAPPIDATRSYTISGFRIFQCLKFETLRYQMQTRRGLPNNSGGSAPG
jgi:hypothetical protein